MMRNPRCATIERGADGTVRVRIDGDDSIQLTPVARGWRVRGLGEPGDWRAERVDGEPGGFRLRSDDDADDEAACTTRMPRSTGEPAEGRHVLLADGRLFRLVERGGLDPRFELLSWEVPGPYLVARPATGGRGWTIEPQPSGGALGDLRALWILMAMEILDSEEPLENARSNDDAP